MVQDQWTETCVSQACALTVWIRAGEDVTAFKMQQSTPAGEDLCRVCVCVCARVSLTTACLDLKQQGLCFHGLRQG